MSARNKNQKVQNEVPMSEPTSAQQENLRGHSKSETLTNLANQGHIAKLKPFKVKPPSKNKRFY